MVGSSRLYLGVAPPVRRLRPASGVIRDAERRGQLLGESEVPEQEPQGSGVARRRGLCRRRDLLRADLELAHARDGHPWLEVGCAEGVEPLHQRVLEQLPAVAIESAVERADEL